MVNGDRQWRELSRVNRDVTCIEIHANTAEDVPEIIRTSQFIATNNASTPENGLETLEHIQMDWKRTTHLVHPKLIWQVSWTMEMSWCWGYQHICTTEQSPNTLVGTSAPVSQIFALGWVNIAINIEVRWRKEMALKNGDSKQCSMVHILLWPPNDCAWLSSIHWRVRSLKGNLWGELFWELLIITILTPLPLVARCIRSAGLPLVHGQDSGVCLPSLCH